MRTESIYSLLGLPDTASPEVVKKAFNKVAKRFHPDMAARQHISPEEEMFFKEVSGLYSDFDRALRDRAVRKTVNPADAAEDRVDVWADLAGFNKGIHRCAHSLFQHLSFGDGEAKAFLASSVIDQIDMRFIGAQEKFQFVYDKLEELSPRKFYGNALSFMCAAVKNEHPLSGRYVSIMCGYITSAMKMGEADRDGFQRAKWLRHEIVKHIPTKTIREPRLSNLHRAVFGRVYEPPSVSERLTAWASRRVGRASSANCG